MRVALRRLWPAVALGVVLAYAYAHRVELVAIGPLLRRADRPALAVAAALQLAFLTDQALLYFVLFRLARTPLPIGFLVEITLAANLANRLAPVAGGAGASVFALAAGRRGVPMARAAAIHLLFYVVDYATFALVVAVLAAVLPRVTALPPGAGPALVGFSGAVGLGLVALVAVWLRPDILRRMAGRHGPEPGAADPALLARLRRAWSRGLSALERELRVLQPILTSATGLLTAAAVGLSVQLVDMGIVYWSFRAFRYAVPPVTLVAGFSLATVLSLVSLVPGGIGVFEASMTGVFRTLGVPLPVAAAVTLLYRVLNFWLPLGLGIPGLRRIAREGG